MTEAIFNPEKEQRPMDIVGFFSGGASSLVAVLEKEEEYKKAKDKLPYRVVAAFTDDPKASGIEKIARYGVPITINDIEACYAEEGYLFIRSKETKKALDKTVMYDIRKKFDSQNAKIIKGILSGLGGHMDYALLSGYMWYLTGNMISEFRTIQNVHPADLTIKKEDGKPKYVGDHAVHLAIKAGEKSTCSTIHIVTEDVDCGPIVVKSVPLPVNYFTDEIRNDPVKFDTFCKEHQNKMKKLCDIPAFIKAVELTAAGEVAFIDDKALTRGWSSW